MKRTNNDNSHPEEPSSGPRDTSAEDHAAIERLEQALEAETKTSAALRDSLDDLRAKVDQIEASFMKRLEDATRRGASAESKLADQQQRLTALGNGHEESMRQLAEARAEIARVSAERDELRKQLARIDGMQTTTVALSEEEVIEPNIRYALPSIEELMASLNSFKEVGSEHDSGHLLAPVTSHDDDEESQEMIAPELVFAEELAEEKAKSREGSSHPRVARVLVFLDDEQPIKYPLYKNVMTIGRSEQADIQVEGESVSRIHARVVSVDSAVFVEDIGSKNGIRVNATLVKNRQELRHGDVIIVGLHRFTFLDTAARNAG
jgi:hypothetical protein